MKRNRSTLRIQKLGLSPTRAQGESHHITNTSKDKFQYSTDSSDEENLNEKNNLRGSLFQDSIESIECNNPSKKRKTSKKREGLSKENDLIEQGYNLNPELPSFFDDFKIVENTLEELLIGTITENNDFSGLESHNFFQEDESSDDSDEDNDNASDANVKEDDISQNINGIIDHNNEGVIIVEKTFKSLASCGIVFMDYQIDTLIRIVKCMLPHIHYSEWDMKKNEILEFYGIDAPTYCVILNIPRQMGKTFVVSIIVKYLLLNIHAGDREKPFTIMVPGLFRSTYEDFISRVRRALLNEDLSDFEVKMNMSEIKLINRKNRLDVRRIFGGSINSEVSNMVREKYFYIIDHQYILGLMNV